LLSFKPFLATAMPEVQKKIASILIDKLGIPESKITPDASFVKDLGIDSLDYAELVMEFEQTFDIKIPDDDAEKMQTIGEATDYIRSKVKA
jgi:acyl carrier protein